MARRDTVFVVHGRDSQARTALFTFLRSLSIKPVEWLQAIRATGKASPSIAEILDVAFTEAQAVVVLLTGDDDVRLNPCFWHHDDPQEEKASFPQARPNVLFEAGLALGRCPDRTVFVEMGKVKPFSDNAGRHVVRLDNTTQKRQELAIKLEIAGCDVDRSGTDWHTAGDLVPSARGSAPAESGLFVPREALSSPTVPSAGALETAIEVTAPGSIDASDFTCRVQRRRKPYWHFGWQLRITNRSSRPATYIIDCRFLDGNGHVLESESDSSGVIVSPGETKQFPGMSRVSEEVAGSVRRVVAVVRSRGAA